MTNCNDGKWHGWNGGECPVHPDTVVQVAGAHCEGSEGVAKSYDWGCDIPTPIVAFRVVKEYKEPREFWIDPFDGSAYPTLKEFRAECGEYSEYIHVREVI